MKNRLKKEGSETVTKCNQLKMIAEGKGTKEKSTAKLNSPL